MKCVEHYCEDKNDTFEKGIFWFAQQTCWIYTSGFRMDVEWNTFYVYVLFT
jgi:hypothetical protein